MIEILAHEIARLAKGLDFLDDQKYKIFCIKEMFEKLRREGKTVERCEAKVGEQFNLNTTTIHSIIYKKKVWGGSLATFLLENDSKTH